MGDWDMGLEGGILVVVDRIWALAGFMGTGHKIGNQLNSVNR